MRGITDTIRGLLLKELSGSVLAMKDNSFTRVTGPATTGSSSTIIGGTVTEEIGTTTGGTTTGTAIIGITTTIGIATTGDTLVQ